MGQPLLDETPHHNQYTEFVLRTARLLDDLESSGVPYRVEVDGIPESPQYLRNMFRRWHEIGVETARIMDLESEEPSIETLKWLMGEAPANVAIETLRQIVDGEHYSCGRETIDWARQQLAARDHGNSLDKDDTERA